MLLLFSKEYFRKHYISIFWGGAHSYSANSSISFDILTWTFLLSFDRSGPSCDMTVRCQVSWFRFPLVEDEQPAESTG
jgi:hypothetical protein